jgi:hypothetical protein
MEIDDGRIQKEWESYLRDRTVSLEYYEEISRGSFSTANPFKLMVASERLCPVEPRIRQVEVR